MRFRSPRLARLARALRLAVACLVLATTFAPRGAALAPAESIVWVAGAVRSVAETSSVDREAARHGEARTPAIRASAVSRFAVSRFALGAPAQARTRIVRSRLYLTHSALLC